MNSVVWYYWIPPDLSGGVCHDASRGPEFIRGIKGDEMNQELLAILDSIERDKGIKKEILIKAIESALISAGRKNLGKHIEDISAKFDPETGDFKVFGPDGNELSGDFGRIAAQTAKQVIIQKIREAERDVVFEEYQKKVNDIASGAVHRFDKGMIIVDLGRVEGILPKRELPIGEEYRQGDRIKALVVEVKKSSKGPMRKGPKEKAKVEK